MKSLSEAIRPAPVDAPDAIYFTCLILGQHLAEMQAMQFLATRVGKPGNRQLAEIAAELVDLQSRLENIVSRLTETLRACD